MIWKQFCMSVSVSAIISFRGNRTGAVCGYTDEPRREKSCFSHMRTTKVQI